MGEVIQFKRPTLAERHKGNTLCRSGFHRFLREIPRPLGRGGIARRC
jgi:hypothetical protein